MLANPIARRAVSAGAVLLASCVAVFAVRRAQKPYAPDAPAFRQQGPATARIIIVEYSDFQCPACRFAVSPMKDILKLYASDVRFIFKHFPLERPHRWARLAARTADCAGQQGRFWEFHDLAYERQESWSGDDGDKKLDSYANELKLDKKALAACIADPAVDASISGDENEGDERWVSSTPTFFINGKRFVGAKQLATRGPPWIDKLLKK